MQPKEKALFDNKYKELFLSLPQPILVIKADDLSIIEVNEAALKFYNYSHDEFLTLHLEDIVYSGKLLNSKKGIREKYSGNTFNDIHRNKDGTAIVVEVHSSKLNLNGYSGLALTIKKSEMPGIVGNIEKEARSHFHNYILSQINEAVVVFSLEGKIVFWNEGAVRLYGYSASEALGKRASEVFHVNLLSSEENEIVHTSLITLGEWKTLDVHSRRDGEKIFVESVSRLMRDENNNITGVISLLRNVTSRVKAEEELRRSKEELNVILKSVAEGITVQDVSGKVVYANDAAAKILGFPGAKTFVNTKPDQLLKKLELFDEYGEKFPVEKLPGRRVLKGEKKASAEVSIKLLETGKVVWSRIKSTPVFDEEGKVRLAINVFHDITDQRDAEQKLRESEIRFRLLVEQSPLSKQIISTNGHTIMINKAWQNLFGSEMKELSDYNVFNDKQLEESGILHYIRKAIDGEESFLPPVKFIPQRGIFKGKPLWLQVYIYPVKSQEDKVIEVVLVHENITEIKNSQEKFEKEYAFRKSIENSVPEGIAVIDLDGKQSYVNPALSKLLGWSKRELLNKYPPFIYWPTDEIDNISYAFESTLKGDIPEKGFVLKFLRKDGEKIDVQLQLSAVHDARGSITGWLASVSDITDRKKVEEKIVASLKEKDILLKEVHHRVKNNMQVIYSLLNLQSVSIKDVKAREAFRESQNRIRTMALIHEKLYQSKEIARIDLPTYLNELIQYISGSYLLNPEKMTIEQDIAPVEVNIDTAISIGLIVNELVSNSIKYAFPEEKHGVIRLQLFKDENDYFKLIISDDGRGIPENINFKTTSTLGLQLVSTLTEQLGGVIGFNTNSGTEFVIAFPNKKDQAAAMQLS